MDNLSVNYLMTMANATQKTPAQISSEMSRERIAATV
jgi:hypothetical protein